MSKKIDLLKEERVQYEGIFDLKELYKHAHDWLEWRKFDVAETKYKEKIKPKGKELEILWEATREIDEYTQYLIKVKWEGFGVTDVQVQREGDKIKMNKGEINAYVSAYLVLDWQEKWEEQPFFKFMQSFFEKYLYKGTIDRLKQDIWKVGWEFFNEIKAFLHLYRYM
ncbi:hypothetical protein GF374_03205 [Candidatus Woesearchaeota archaeon]|nr:hypothetical protein [Candidatus Woesearchaeota archaeon]